MTSCAVARLREDITTHRMRPGGKHISKRARHHMFGLSQMPRRRNPTPIPPELYRAIVQWVSDPQDLYSLCLTSRRCFQEAEPLLYRYIDLPGNSETIGLWAPTILNNPRKAGRVYSLTLRFDLSHLLVSDMLLPSLKLISQSLKALPNLKCLSLYGHRMAMMHSIYSWIIDGCTTELQSFHNELFQLDAVVPFLHRRSHIVDFTQSGLTTTHNPFHPSVLPRLSTLEADASILEKLHSPSRPVRRLRFILENPHHRMREAELLASLDNVGTTLEVLDLHHVSNKSDRLSASEIIQRLAQLTPRLRLLVLRTNNGPSSENPLPPASLALLSNFHNLEALVFVPAEIKPRAGRSFAPSPSQKLWAASVIGNCPSLRVVAIVNDRHTQLRTYQRRLCTPDGELGVLETQQHEGVETSVEKLFPWRRWCGSA